jgi:hypothetical protein
MRTLFASIALLALVGTANAGMTCIRYGNSVTCTGSSGTATCSTYGNVTTCY